MGKLAAVSDGHSNGGGIVMEGPGEIAFQSGDVKGLGSSNTTSRPPQLTGHPGSEAETAATSEEQREQMKTDVLELTVQTLGGGNVVLHASPRDTVRQVKERLSRPAGATASQQRLVFGNDVLQDRKTLAGSGVSPPKARLQLVIVSSSGLSRHLEAQQRCAEDFEDALEASLADIADSVFQAEHALSERWRPRASELLTAMTPKRRAELINWMLQAFDILQFDDMLLHNVVLTLDRYCSRRATPLDEAALQRVLLSAVCTEMKTANADDFPLGQWQHLLLHLCQGRVSLTVILRTECEVLKRLGFVVGVPTPLAFLRSLALRLRGRESQAPVLSLAVFLLELALFDAQLEYSYPHVVLAAGALGAALWTSRAAPEHHEGLVEDLAAYCPDVDEAEKLLVACEEELLTLWFQCAMGVNEWTPFFGPLQAKFGRHARHQVVAQGPPHDVRPRWPARNDSNSCPRVTPLHGGAHVSI